MKIKEIINKHTDDERVVNLDKRQINGLHSLQTRKKNGEIIMFPTDKSGGIAVNTPENYNTGMQVHLKDNEEVTMDLYKSTEELLNAHMQVWCKIIKADERTRRNFISNNNEVPPEYGLLKDHKEITDPVKGPPTRPVCGAIISSNYRISYFMSTLLKPFVKLTEEACDSTEDLLSRIKACNINEDIKNCIIGGFDVEALYPSLDIEFAIEKCIEVMSEFDVEYQNFDIEEVGLYLAMNLNEKDLIKEGLQKYCPSRSCPGRRPKTTSAGKKMNKNKRWNKWINRISIPDKNNEKRLILKAIGITLKIIFNNHIYTFNQKLYRQIKRGAIGVGITVEVANLFMVWWDRQLKSNLLKQGVIIKMYSRYVDDGTIVVKTVTDYNEEMDKKEIEKETMEIIKNTANKINKNIKVKADYPSNHNNNRMPSLDLELWIDEVEINGELKPQILHSHYMKPMANKHVILKNSAIAVQKKFRILSNDLLRIMRNVSPKCKNEELEKVVQYYINRLQYSGYNKEDKVSIYKKAKRIYKDMTAKNETGEKPLYRSKSWNLSQRIKEKEKKRRQWFMKGGYVTTMFVEATPNQILAKDIQKQLNGSGLKIKVIEKAGEEIQRKLVKSDPYKSKNCDDENCRICKDNPNINCKSREVNYSVNCEDHKVCKGEYKGETSRSLKERGEEHLQNYYKKEKKSVFYQHMIEKHEGNMKELKFDIYNKYPGDPLLRQVTEAVLIRELKPQLNAKLELSTQNSSRIRKNNVGKFLGSVPPQS